MNSKQLEILTRIPKIKTDDLENKSDRTLVYGHADLDGNLMFHLYLKNEMFHFTLSKSKIDQNDNNPKTIKSFKFREELPPIDMFHLMGLHFYPECCDYEFCSLLNHNGIALSYDKLDKDRPNKKYYGILFEDLKRK